MHGRISPRRACNPCGYTMKMSSRYHKLLIYDVNGTTKIESMGPFNVILLSKILFLDKELDSINLLVSLLTKLTGKLRKTITFKIY